MRAELDYNRADFLETAQGDSRTGEVLIEIEDAGIVCLLRGLIRRRVARDDCSQKGTLARE